MILEGVYIGNIGRWLGDVYIGSIRLCFEGLYIDILMRLGGVICPLLGGSWDASIWAVEEGAWWPMCRQYWKVAWKRLYRYAWTVTGRLLCRQYCTVVWRRLDRQSRIESGRPLYRQYGTVIG
jgi:hypothetical protein